MKKIKLKTKILKLWKVKKMFYRKTKTKLLKEKSLKMKKKEEKAEANPPPEKPVLTPELQQVIYIIRTNIILWSGKHESEVKL